MRGRVPRQEGQMDQVKTGNFLKALRRERGWTQSQFAEKLQISEKTVSKWETGRGLPDVALMLPVCELLGVTVNELLSGERLSAEGYRVRAEENILDLARDRTKSATKAVVCNAACIVCIAVALALVLVAALCDLPVWARILLIVCAILGICAVLAPILLVAVSVEVFSCPACGKRFVPTLRAYILGPHTFRKRRLKCPHCGKKSWCASSLRAEDVSPERRKTD